MNAYQELAQRLARIERRLGVGALANASLEDTAIPSYAPGGSLQAYIGRQWDGAHGILAVNGPAHPAPAAPTVEPVPRQLLVHWNGDWDPAVTVDPVSGTETAVVAGSNWVRNEVHVSTDPDFTGLLSTTLKTTISSPRGGYAQVPGEQGVNYWVRLVARTDSGGSSAGPVVGPFLVGKNVAEDLAIDLDAISGNKIYYGNVEPITDKIGDLWLKWVNSPTLPAQYETYRWDGDSWDKLRDTDAAGAILEAEAAAAAAALRARLFVQPDAPTGLGADDEAIWVDDNDGNRSYTWSGSAWVSRRLGNGAIEPNSLVASDVIATGTVSAALLEAVMILVNTIIIGDPAGDHTIMDGTRLAFQTIGPEGEPVEISRFGRSSGGSDPTTGLQTWNIPETGVAAFQSISTVQDPIFQGQTLSELIGGLAGGFYAGASLGSLTDPATTPNTTGGEAMLYEFTVECLPGFAYLLLSSNFWVRPTESSTNRIDVNLRYTVSTTPGVAPPPVSVVSPLYDRWPQEVSGLLGHGVTLSRILRKDIYVHYRFLVTLSSTGGGAYIEMGSGNHTNADIGVVEPDSVSFLVADLGEHPWTNRMVRRDSGSSGGTTPPTNAVERHTYTYYPLWTRRFRGDLTVHSDGADAAQGYTPYYTPNGDQRTQIGDFRRNGATIGLVADLAGATIEKMEVYLYATHWHYNAGGTAMIRYHNNVGPTSYINVAGLVTSAGWPRNAGRWVNITSWGNTFRDGGAKGIVVGPSGGTDPQYYGIFNGHAGAHPPAIRVTYTKAT